MIRRFGDPVRHGQHYRPRPGAYAILPREGRLLLTYQGAPHFEHQLPGGGLDAGEAPIPALHREVFEETGWRISTPRLLGIYRRFTYMPEYDRWAEKICRIYLARPVRRHSNPREPGHHALWMSPEEALDLLHNSGDRTMLAAYLRAQH